MKTNAVKFAGVKLSQPAEEFRPFHFNPLVGLPCALLGFREFFQQWEQVGIDGGGMYASAFGDEIDAAVLPVNLTEAKSGLAQPACLVESDLERDVVEVAESFGALVGAQAVNARADGLDMPVGHFILNARGFAADAELEGGVSDDVTAVDGFFENERKEFQFQESAVMGDGSLGFASVAMALLLAPIDKFKTVIARHLRRVGDFFLFKKGLNVTPRGKGALQCFGRAAIPAVEERRDPSGEQSFIPLRCLQVFFERAFRCPGPCFAFFGGTSNRYQRGLADGFSGGGFFVTAPPKRTFGLLEKPRHTVCVGMSSGTNNIKQPQTMSNNLNSIFCDMPYRGFESPPLRQLIYRDLRWFFLGSMSKVLASLGIFRADFGVNMGVACV